MKTTTNTAPALFNLSVGTSLKLNGRKFSIVSIIEMSKYPNAAKFIAHNYVIEGPRGAQYGLDVRHDGSAFYVSPSGLRARCVDVDLTTLVVGKAA